MMVCLGVRVGVSVVGLVETVAPSPGVRGREEAMVRWDGKV